MFRFVAQRFLIAIFLLLIMSFMTFMLMRLTPGNYLDTLRMDPQVSAQTLAHYEKIYHLNQPPVVQYVHWLMNVLRGEMGYSFYFNVPVTAVIGGRLWNTLVLSLSAFLLTWIVAIPLGICSAVHKGRWLDRCIQMAAYVLLSVPGFFVALILLFWASRSGVFPLGGMTSPSAGDWPWWRQMADVAAHLVIPTVALSLGSVAALQKIMRGNFLEELGKQYVLSARAKGLPEHRVLYGHALRNALNPMVTLLGYEFSGLLSGAALMEIITSWPGLGSLMLTAVRSKDIYLVMASMLMGGMMFILGNLLADICLAKLDPRIRYGR